MQPESGLVVDACILKEADDKMLNTYTAIAVNPEAPFTDADGNAVFDVAVNTAGADALIQWFLTQEALDMAGNYGVAEYGEYLFYVKDNAPVYAGEIAPATEESKVIRLSTTTSVNDSGLLGFLLLVFIIGTYNADGTPNAMNAAWGGISEETEITICVDSTHKTAENLISRKAFTVSMATANCVAACDYVGLVSGNKEPDKFAKAGFHATKSEFVDAPLIDELPMAMAKP